MRRWSLALVIAVGCSRGAGAAPGAPPGATAAAILDGLGADDLGEVERAVAAIAARPADQADPDVLLAAARACEDKLLDPGRASALYARVIAEHATARAATAAARRIAALRPLVGAHGETAREAGGLARLIGRADRTPAAEVIAAADRLAGAAWPGAPEAALWLADWLRRSGRLGDAQARYAAVIARWPGAPQAAVALRAAASCAVEARAWSLAAGLAARLPAADRALRDELLAAAVRGHRRDQWHLAAWLAIAGALAGLAGSLLEARRRCPSSGRWAPWRPPLEIVFLAPVAAVLVGVAFTAQRMIAPAVTTIAAGGLVLAWLSGTTLELLRAAGRPTRLRGVAHVIACLAGVAGLAYVAITRGGLLDTLIETVRFGPQH
jgi:hypothetical protein